MTCEPRYRVRPVQNLKDMIEQSVKLYAEKDAFLVKEGGNYRGIKYKEYKSDLDALGTALIDLGLKDKFIAVIGENRYEWTVTYLAVVNGVGVVVPLDKELPPNEIENLLTRSGACAVVFSGKLDKEMRQISSTLNSVKYYINMDLDEDDGSFLSFRQLVKKGKELLNSGNRSYIDAKINNEALSVLIFTSGTTDHAKGVMLSHKNICSNVMAVCSSLYIDDTDSALSILPLHHTYECTCGFLVMIYNGCTVAFNEGLKYIAKNLQETKPSLMMAVPLILENMYRKIWDQASKKRGMKLKLKAAMAISDFLYYVLKIDIRKKLFKQIHENIGGRIRLIISGAAAIEPSVLKGFRSMGIQVLQGYGLTECSPIVTVNREEAFKHNSIGLPLPGVEVKLEDVNSEGIGEIVVKGDNVMLGYFDNPFATAKVLKGGWFYTGDLGRVDESGFFYMAGRKKNVIVTKNGKNIFPEEVEAYLNKSPYIEESLVWGKYDEVTGETTVNAQIFPNIDAIKEHFKTSHVTMEDIYKIISAEVKLVNRTMPLYKHVRGFTIRENEFAKTTTKKIKRYVEKTG